LILVYPADIKTNDMLINVLEFVKSVERSIIIFCQSIEKEPLSMLVYNKVKGGMNVILFYLVYCGNCARLY
jgi:chaperonin GroEL (HSP60 family)